MKARVYVTLKSGVLDPQGQAVAQALMRLGFGEVSDVRIGKLIEIELTAPPEGGRGGEVLGEDERRRLLQMCERLLANPVLEDFRVEYAE